MKAAARRRGAELKRTRLAGEDKQVLACWHFRYADHQVAPLSSLVTMPTTAKKASVPAKKGVSDWILTGLLIEHAICARLSSIKGAAIFVELQFTCFVCVSYAHHH